MDRDNQRKKVHTAIRATDKAVGKPLPTMSDVNAFVKKIISRAALKRRYGKTIETFFEVKDGRGYSWATGERDFITCPVHERTTIYILRAMAKMLTARHRVARYYFAGSGQADMMNRNAAWNGWEFCAIMMDLVRYGLGETEGKALKSAFDKNGVRYCPPRKPKKRSSEQLAELQERGRKLAAMNADRKKRLEYAQKHPEAILENPDKFADETWETLYLVWR